MPNLEYPSGSFVTSKDVKTGDIIKFLDAGEEKEKEFKGKKKLGFNIAVELPDGEQKVLSLNDTSKRNIMDFYGFDSDKWIGKEARIEVVTQKVSNEFKDVVYLTAPGKNLKGDLIYG